MFSVFRHKSGYISLLTVLITMASLVVIATVAGWKSISEAQSGLFIHRGNQAMQLAEACAAEALYRLKLDADYNGGVVALNEDSCEITMSNKNAVKTMNVVARKESFTYNLAVVVKLVATSDNAAQRVYITKWQ